MASMSRSSSSTRRPTISKASGSSSPQTQAKRFIADEDDVLVLSPKSDKENVSIGKSGGVGMGVTRPKRRLSSLPTLPHPLHASSSSSRAQQNGISPPGTPSNGHPQSTYHALRNQRAGSSPYTTPPRMEGTYSPGTPSKDKEGSPRLLGIELKWISLITLALQNALLTIIMHYSRISTTPNKTYSASSAVLMNELLKGLISVSIALRRIQPDPSASDMWSEKDTKDLDRRIPPRRMTPSRSARLRQLAREVFSPDCYKLAVPAILYVIQNNLQYVAASNLDVATFQVTYQMKILTTAFFSVVMLRKRLSRTKWVALVMLALGVGIVQIQSSSAPSHSVKIEPANSTEPAVRVMHPLRGFLAVAMACLTSGLAGVYFEYILKASGSSSGSSPDLWVRNTQLSLFSLVPALVPILFTRSGPDGVGWLGRVMNKFSHFNGWALGTVLTQTFGGLVTAVVIRYSDNIMKGFATSLSIIISFLASVALFSYPITVAFCLGSSIVLASTYLYNLPASKASSQTRTDVAVTPGSPILPTAPILGEPEVPSRVASVMNLVGLGSASSSRRTSASDLRTAAANQLSFTQVSPMSLSSDHVYPASAPGTPYSSTSPSSTSLYDQRLEQERGYLGVKDVLNGTAHPPPPRRDSPPSPTAMRGAGPKVDSRPNGGT